MTTPVIYEHGEPSSICLAAHIVVAVDSDHVEAGDGGVGIRYLLV